MNIQEIKQFIDNLSQDLTKNINDMDKFLLQFNTLQSNEFKPNKNNFLYPHVLDKLFNDKLIQKKEFLDMKYPTEIQNVEKEAEKLCNADFELAPHQIFIRNFLSFYTPYNSLLLYHGLGTGKTCSAISVCEEMRDYMKQLGITKRIIIVASPNVQKNFETQLFDERKLKEINGLWNLRACTGNKFIKEINPMNMKGISKDKLVRQIKKIIKQNYVFMGYIEFSNYIEKIKEKYNIEGLSKDEQYKRKLQAVKKEFSNRLIVIDEVHNIRISGDNPKKKIAQNLLDMVRYTDTLKLLLLSATPMFNNYQEIIWLLNLMNINDGRPPVQVKDIFNKKGDFKLDKDGNNIGKELLINKLRGYVSFVRGENPYTFPYRIFPSEFNKDNTLKSDSFIYPRYQINKNIIKNPIEYLDLYITNIGDYQKHGYELAIQKLQKKLPNEETIDKGLGWEFIESPLQTLNMVYPHNDIDEFIERNKKSKSSSKSSSSSKSINISNFVGKNGLQNVMMYEYDKKNNFEYTPMTIEKYGRIFSQEHLHKYSGKLSKIIDSVKNSKGIILIYSQYIDGGCVPIALALEELGITRYNNKSLFKKPPVEQLDAITMKPKEKNKPFYPARYIMITGDSKLSPNNLLEVKAATDDDNINGEKVKVIIISKAGSEGIDFKNIRQCHIVEPWYNMSRNEQVIGRAVRFRSHCQLPFKERNVEIYLYGSKNYNEYEPIDLYIYRMAEEKAIKIGEISRILKENAVDCFLNSGINELTATKLNQSLNINLSSGKTIHYQIGDKPFSQICDYMDKCSYTCNIQNEPKKTNMDTYNENFISLNIDKIISKIKTLYTENYVFTKTQLIQQLNKIKQYPIIQINSALEHLVTDKSEFLIDMFGRNGHLINIDQYYMFQPIEISSKKLSRDERSKPIEFKPIKFNIQLKQPDIKEKTILSTIQSDIIQTPTKLLNLIKNNYQTSITKQDIKRGEKNWYLHVNITIERLSNLIEKTILEDFVLQHIIDNLLLIERKQIIEYLINNKLNEFESKILEYINNTYLVKHNDNIAYLIAENNKPQLWIVKQKNNLNLLDKAKPLDYQDFASSLLDFKFNKSEFNDIVGFMMKLKDENDIVFKTKAIYEKRNKGARCNQAGKQNIIKTLNLIKKSEDYTKENTKKLKIPQMCSEEEFLLRYYNLIKKDNKIWYLPYEYALLNEIETI